MRDLTSGPEGRLVFTFAVPMLIGNLFQQLYNMVDSVVVGQFVSRYAGGRWKRKALTMGAIAARRQSHG